MWVDQLTNNEYCNRPNKRIYGTRHITILNLKTSYISVCEIIEYNYLIQFSMNRWDYFFMTQNSLAIKVKQDRRNETICS